MTSIATSLRPGPSQPPHPLKKARLPASYAVPLAVVAVVLLRLAYVGAPISSDEGGFLVVGGQWHAHGTSLYGDYWVDRPPLLITAFRVAALLGGLTPLRLIGCLAAAVTVGVTAAAADLLAGPRARATAALMAAVLLATPLLGTVAVNGELLASPFVAGSVLAALRGLRSPTLRGARRCGAAAGGLCLAAVLVKQNMADGAVLAALLWTASWARHDVDAARWRSLVSGALTGAVATVIAVAAWAGVHGTGPRGVFDAMYPFRLRAARVLAQAAGQAGGRTGAEGRLHLLLVALLLSGIPLVVLVLALHAGRAGRAPRHLALAGMLGFAVVSILAGGSFWSHYLVELVVPAALTAGLLVGERARFSRGLAVVLVVASVLGWSTGLLVRSDVASADIGRSIATVAHPSDTIVNAFGGSDLVERSGLASPYPYLWKLPARVLDPSMSRLADVLRGPQAPTWLVVRGPGTGRDLRAGTGSLIERRYRPVARVCGRLVYLLDGVRRPAPPETGSCRAPLAGALGRGTWRHDV